ncbi:MAG: family 16 glycoside hydrolase [Pirellulaceae bacterium]
MSNLRVLLSCVAIALGVFCHQDRAAADQPPVWKPLADGQTLKGWHKNGEGDWTVEDGAYVGRSNMAKLYGHLVSDEKYQDFTVRFDFQCPSGDSGFFVRTEMQEPDKTLGLQIQVGPLGSGTGGIYESYGRAWLQKPSDELEKSGYRVGRWNEMIIAAHGAKVTVHVNGIKTADLNDDKIGQKAGVFALQMHSGVVNETHFKNLAILERGEITPKHFLGTDAPTVKPAADNSLSLSAADGLGIGPEIHYMPEWAAFGSFTDQDRSEWPIEVSAAGPYDVELEWSVADDQAGQAFVLEVGDQKLAGTVAKSGSAETYKKAHIGKLQLAAGAQRAVLRPTGQFATTLMNLREVKLVPAATK